MKGNLIKTEQGWFVQYIGNPINVLKGEEQLVNYFPLHPENLSSEVIRWANNGSLDDKQVEFEIVDGYANIQTQTNEMTDEEIKEGLFGDQFDEHDSDDRSMLYGAKWYREQLKNNI